jgi:hypothetical protein
MRSKISADGSSFFHRKSGEVQVGRLKIIAWIVFIREEWSIKGGDGYLFPFISDIRDGMYGFAVGGRLSVPPGKQGAISEMTFSQEGDTEMRGRICYRRLSDTIRLNRAMK